MQAVSDPAILGFDPKRLKHIDTWMQRYVDEGRFPGSSVLVARHGQIAHLATAGRRSIEDDLPYELDTIVRIYSMTKPITSVAVMMLAERGHFHLDAPISRFLPEFSECRALIDGATSLDQTKSCPPPTIHQLLVHTSGLTYSFNQGPLADAYLEQKADFNNNSGGLEAASQKVAQLPLAFTPGESWEYSVSIVVIGRIVVVVSGKTLE
ncbi:MAG: serine hydrolase domain-containing protein, partial [Pseudomonadota bacterium]